MFKPYSTYSQSGFFSFETKEKNVTLSKKGKDYFTFGSQMTGRTWVASSIEKYRFGFNGKEGDNEINVVGGGYDFGARIYDSRLGRWLSLDPLARIAPFESHYSYVSNNPNIYIDVKGKTKKLIINVMNNETGEKATLEIIVNDDLKKSTYDQASAGGGSIESYVGWYDINIVVNITIDKDGKTTKSSSEEHLGECRFKQHPLLDLLGFTDNQKEVNEKLNNKNDGKQKKWGGIHWTWSKGQGKESKQSDAKDKSVRIENIDLLMDVLTAMSPNDFKVPDELLKDNVALELLNVLQTTMDRQSNVIDCSVNAIKTFKEQIIDRSTNKKDDTWETKKIKTDNGTTTRGQLKK